MSKFGFIEPIKDKEVKDLIFPMRTLIPIPELQEYEYEACIGDEVILDVECYPNYFLICLKHLKSGKFAIFEESPAKTIDRVKLSWCLFAFKIYTFNGNHYDMPLVYMC